MGLYRLLRPLLYRLPADLTHEVSLWAFRRRIWGLTPGTELSDPVLRTRVAGIELANPFGLAAGYDKNGEITPSMADLGFGFVVVGSVRPHQHPGNPRPWFVRKAYDGGLVNAMGLPSKGASHIRSRLGGAPSGVPVFISIAGDTAPDFVAVRESLDGLATAWEVNISCPNTETGRTFEEDPEALRVLLDLLQPFTEGLFLKFSPYLRPEERERTLDRARLAVSRGFKNFVLTNTLAMPELGVGAASGGLSGRPLFPMALQAIQDFRAEFGDEVQLVGVGGVTTGEQAFQMIKAGAGAVEILTALILRGPGVVRHLASELGTRLKAEGFATVAEAVGSAG
ncbi:MAG: dihydroorotate dehydrogenase 2 [Thermoplasmata archaeon]|nr:dihydroorotate dehydrogenase 2 [Thermoplasmata archaeon]